MLGIRQIIFLQQNIQNNLLQLVDKNKKEMWEKREKFINILYEIVYVYNIKMIM